MAGILWRVLIAVICVALALALIPPVAAEIGLSLSGNLLKIIKICIAGLAVLYILRGATPSWSRP